MAPLTPAQFTEGVLQIAVVFLSVVAGALAVTMFKHSHKRKELRAWKPLIAALILFALEMIFGFMKAWNFMDRGNPITHIIPSFILGFVIWALVQQILIKKYHGVNP